MGRTAPITRFALAFAAGTGLGMLGAPVWTAPLLLLLSLAAPIAASPRPDSRVLLCAIAAAGLLASRVDAGDRCASTQADERAVVSGRFLATPRSGSAPFQRDDRCGVVTVVVSAETTVTDVSAGQLLLVEGVWREGRRRPWLKADRTEALPDSNFTHLRWRTVRWRDTLVGRLHELYGPNAELVSALVLARREGLDPALRDAFAVTGIAHLLAISGFHVGVIAGLALGLLRGLGVGRRRAELGAATISAAYVGLIGFPDAACRALLILVFVAASRARGCPPTRWGALCGAGLLLLILDPGKLTSPGFQLSFAGSAGLVAWSKAFAGGLERLGHRRLPAGLVGALASGAAATLATLPVVAWHFERVSLIGIPMTMAAAPLVSLALPGALMSLVMDTVAPAAASLLAGGVSTLLDGLVQLTEQSARLPGVTAWTSRASVVAALSGLVAARHLARRPGVGQRGRRLLAAAYVTTGIVAWPVITTLQARGTLELMMIDVGQGDAIAIRTPKGRWLLVDAGPPLRPVVRPRPAARAQDEATDRRGPREDPRSHPVVRALRGRGVRRLEVLVLTHPDLDHVGGAESVLATFDVGLITDPAIAAPKSAYAALLSHARAQAVPWVAARAGQTTVIDGVRLRLLHPPASVSDATEANEASVVLLVTWAGFAALLTGDAYVDVERGVMETVGDVDVLKVGHHGSDTSTDSVFLTRVRPEVALISVGRQNRYGHPSPRVLQRLRAAGAAIHRTDRHGTLRVIVRRDGSYDVRTDRGPT